MKLQGGPSHYQGKGLTKTKREEEMLSENLERVVHFAKL